MKDYENFNPVEFNNRVIEIRKYFEEIGFNFPFSYAEAFRQYQNQRCHYLDWWWADLLEFCRSWELAAC